MSPPWSPSSAVLKMLAERPAVTRSVSMARIPPHTSAHLIRYGSVHVGIGSKSAIVKVSNNSIVSKSELFPSGRHADAVAERNPVNIFYRRPQQFRYAPRLRYAPSGRMRRFPIRDLGNVTESGGCHVRIQRLEPLLGVHFRFGAASVDF